MITIDWQLLVQDFMWFGCSYQPARAYELLSTCTRIGETDWVYSQWWTLRLWPVRREGLILPDWYIAIFKAIGYIGEEDEYEYND